MVFSLPLTASAVDSYHMPINEPTCGDNQGYILLLVENISSGVRSVHCLSWSMCYINVDSSEPLNSAEMNITVGSDNTIKFTALAFADGDISVGFCRSLNGTSKRTIYWSDSSSSGLLSYTYSIGSSYKCIGFQVYGNSSVLSHPFGSSNNIPFYVTWGSDMEQVQKLTEIIAELYVLAENDETIISQLNELLGHAQTAEELLTSIKTYLYVNNSQNDTIISRLTEILKILRGSGESTFEEPSTESISDYNKAEDELVSGAEDTSDIEQQIEDFEIDADSSSLIWSIIQGYLSQNELVFGLVIGILCLGIIALILNR